MVRYKRSSSSRGVGVESPWSGPLKRVGTDWAADRTRRRRKICVVLPPQDSSLGSARAVYSQAGTGPVGYSGFGFGHFVEVDIIVGQRTFGRLWLGPLGKVELQVDGHLTVQEGTGYWHENAFQSKLPDKWINRKYLFFEAVCQKHTAVTYSM